MNIERIIICFHEDGTLKEASAQDYAGLPAPISADQLAKLKLGNVAEIDALRLQLTESQTEVTALKATITKHEAESDALANAAAEVLANSVMDDTSRAALDQIVAMARSFGTVREKLKLEAEARAKQQEAADLLAKAEALAV